MLKIAIIILPLLALGAEQEQKVRQLPSADPIFINSDNVNRTGHSTVGNSTR
jgi:hypothetical protein